MLEKSVYDELNGQCDELGKYLNTLFRTHKHGYVQLALSQIVVKLNEIQMWSANALNCIDQAESTAEEAVASGSIVDMTGEGVKIVGGNDGSA